MGCCRGVDKARRYLINAAGEAGEMTQDHGRGCEMKGVMDGSCLQPRLMPVKLS